MDNQENKLIIWGRNPVIEALKAGRSLEKILIAHDSHPPKELLELAEKRKVKLQKVPRQKIEELAGTKKTQGVIALVSPIKYIDENKLLKKIIEENGILLVLDHITDPQNVGNIIRTAEVLGANGILLPKERSSPINEVVVKSSTGAVFHIPIAKVGSLRQTLENFKKMGGWVVVVEKGGKDIDKIKYPFPLALVVGSEGKGVSKSVIDIADIIATIPMKGKVTSLNVSSATAIALWEAIKQKI
ncbi:23S rRNA (guanosine(2251)-2'-O)-methyltransferase RlmB [Venenivibrio stagnispumantis]|uniref:23S rRNA (Guanosine2251-2'-O)-methyltransferase n=1 Tax=Venenivibrio stagnispumantis TaxID=407998 RepID=A0AA45WL71_9AQUI|nr:23S rRNA (guanosine(2251)-2'-O)-methyltransferase RlmB [Venenivibrio stagnispumantis]MCW4573682.1 23S rRNA (guanosine(2251)-2'-O)-methyltransferase RlmB [Venenivibrio stagnispumantis]SMP09917.1 23S rRNA (guanosine2251-2'-O)-methyltransferase [Venenivibrio stagnispumantis]